MTVLDRYGRKIFITDAVDQTALQVIDNPDNLCVGLLRSLHEGRGWSRLKNKMIVFPMSDVVDILDPS